MPRQKMPEPRQTVPPMSSDVMRSASFARRLIEIEADRQSVGREFAKHRVARREGVPLGTLDTLDNILRGRVKGVAAWVRDRLAAAVVREIQQEMARLEHELQIARLTAEDAHDVDVAAAQAALAHARELISRQGKENPAGGRRGLPLSGS